MTHKSEKLHTILPEKKESPISSVVVLPEKLEFETQNPNERVYIMLRRHLITNFGWVFIACTLFVLPFFASFLLRIFDIELVETFNLKYRYPMGVMLLWYLFTTSFCIMKFLNWYFNIYVITNERIIDFDFSPIAYHKISEAGLENIEDATQENIGFFPMLFNYGDVYIQTAGQKREFDFTSVPKPAWVRDKIMDLRDLQIKGSG